MAFGYRISRRELLRLMTSAPVTLGISAAAGAANAGAEKPGADAPYRDASLPVHRRVEDLLSRMSVEEKVAQMITLWKDKAQIMDGLDFSPERASAAFPHGFGQVARPSDKRGGPGVADAVGGTAARWRTPRETVEFINGVQRWARHETRLGIPVLFHEESLHGYMAADGTMFPQAIALAGTFDTDLVKAVNAAIAREVRATGVTLVLSPVVDIARDPRWGRIEETFGEDPFLAGEMGVAAIEGLQGDGKFEMLGEERVFATLKHMTGHGQPEAGNNVAPALLGERELRSNFFPPFREAVERTSIGAVMPSYNEIDGVPSHANTWLLRDVLRGEWGFEGIIVSDYFGISELDTLHHVAADPEQAARLALKAGVDCELPDGEAYPTLVEQLRQGRIDMSMIDEAISRILALKFRSGLFENPLGDAERIPEVLGNAGARELALEAARKSLCLLKNDGVLPLKPGGHPRIAVIGPNAAIARLGGYSGLPKRSVSLLEGIRDQLQGKAELLHAQGVHITQSEDRADDDVRLADPGSNRKLIAEAAETARSADVVILAIGDTEQTSREAFATDHLGDRTDLDLVGQQNDLFQALLRTGKPLVVCAINGRPPSWPGVAEGANAILECWYPGQEGGTAMAEALFGVVNPGAKLPVTVVREVGQVPYYYNHRPSARRGYLFSDASPLFPFGHGLSYTTFELSEPRLSKSTIGPGESVDVAVDVRNTGSVAGDEVVQVYVRDEAASVTQPVQSLRGFRRLTLGPGEHETVTIRLGPEAFRIWNDRMEEVTEPGTFRIMAGGSSVKLKSAILEIIAPS